MRKLWLLLPLMGVVFLMAPTADACHKKPKCVCDCNAKCRYGKTCKKVKKCKVYRACKKKLVCSCGRDKKCNSKKAKLCHIPPGNPFNAHTICVGKSAVQAHLDHGDYLGKCRSGCEKRKVCKSKVCCRKVKKCICNKYNPKCPPCECPEPDAGMADMTPVEPDAGMPDMTPVKPDMTPVKPDMTPVKPDMTPVKPDMTPVEPDMGPADPDMEPTEPDMEPTEPDMEPTEPDMTPMEPDAGVPDMTPMEPDMGPTEPDMEVIEVDGGECPTCPDSSTEESEEDLELVGGGCSVGSNSNYDIGIILGFLFLFVGILRRSKLILIASIVAISFSAFGSNVYASPPVNNFKTAPSVNDYYTTMNPKTLGHLDFNTQLMMNYSHKPLRVIDKATGDTVDNVLRFRMNMDFTMSLGLFDRLELGLVVPTSAGQGAGNLGPIDSKLNNHNFQLPDFKDLRFVPKVHLGSVSLLDFGFALPITMPTGDRERLLGENGPTLTPVWSVGLDHKYFDVAMNVGVVLRNNQEHDFSNQNINSGEEFLYGVGLNVPLVKDFGWLHNLDLIGDLWGGVQFEEQNKEEVSLEAMGGLRAHLKHGIVANVAAGGGLTKGYGVPEYRVLWGFGWEFDWKEKTCPTCNKCVPKVVEKVKVKVVEKVVPKVVNRALIISPVYFDTDKSELRPDAIETLDKTVELLKKNPWVKKVRLEGHCDFRASNKYNEELAWRRVYAVRNYLLNSGVKTVLEPRGYGETQPVNNSKEEPGLQKNRRVEFHILEVE